MSGGHGSTVERGRRGEDIAAQALETYGFTVVDRNWRCRAGEIDLIARDGDCWVFVEVKTRGGDEFGAPEEAVTPEKQSRLASSALAYLAEIEAGDVPWRIDVVAIELGSGGKVRRLTHHRSAGYAQQAEP
ncbi:MAG: YraN family protein [Anaerolineae bacterium]